jgi:hypothetical protein
MGRGKVFDEVRKYTAPGAEEIQNMRNRSDKGKYKEN